MTLANQPNRGKPIMVAWGQPYDTAISGQSLSQIDYLVAHEWELGPYAPPEKTSFDLDAAARRLLAYGVETLCVPDSGGCNIYSEPLATWSQPFLAVQGVRHGPGRFLCRAGRPLIDKNRQFSEEVALWATAAMAHAMADHPMPNPMPDRRRVQQVLERSRFSVNLRPSQ